MGDACYSSLPWKVGVHGGKHGPMGEDLFAQKCMDLMGVAKQENFGLTTDGACEGDRPADQKKNKKFIPSCDGTTGLVSSKSGTVCVAFFRAAIEFVRTNSGC